MVKNWCGTKEAEFRTGKMDSDDEEQILVLEEQSVFLFDSEWVLRKFAVRLVEHPWFDQFILVVIVANSVLMCLTDFNERIYGENYFSKRNYELDKVDLVFTVIFIFECLVKVIAKGFLFHQNAYLRDAWNCLDFFVVMVSVINFLPFASADGLKALRTFRNLRPLRTINRAPNMKQLVTAMLESIYGLLGVLFFLTFTFIVFAIFGVQTFKGTQYNFCRTV